MRLGNYFLERDRAYDRARLHFVSASDESNRDEDMRAEATLKMGVCFYYDRNYGKCFQVMRGVIGNSYELLRLAEGKVLSANTRIPSILPETTWKEDSVW